MIKKLAVLGIIIAAACTSAAAQDTLTVVSYNIFNAQDPANRGESTLEEIGNFISDIRPDLLSLQEVDSSTNRLAALNDDTYFNLADSLAKRTGMHASFGKAMEFDGGSYGVALLSKHPLSLEKISLPNPEEGEPRALLYGDMPGPSGRSLRVAATHLDHEHPNNRMQQLHKLNEVLLDTDTPVVLAGDLNFTADSEEYQLLQSSWKDAAAEQQQRPEPTFPTDNPDSRIDYILFSKNHRWEVIEYRTPKVNYSDHLPIVATVVLQ